MKHLIQQLEKSRKRVQRYSYSNEIQYHYHRWNNRSKCLVKYFDSSYTRVAYQYVSTHIVEVNTNNNTIKLNTDGWHTVTSKKYINELLRNFNINAYIFQKDFVWYLKYNDTTIQYQDDLIIKLDNNQNIELVYVEETVLAKINLATSEVLV